MTKLAGVLEGNRAKRRARAARDAQVPAILVRNQCVHALAALEPAAALQVVLGLQKSLVEFIQAEATGYVRAGKSY